MKFEGSVERDTKKTAGKELIPSISRFLDLKRRFLSVLTEHLQGFLIELVIIWSINNQSLFFFE